MNPFEDFINSLKEIDEINDVPNDISPKDYVDILIDKYGLPLNEDARNFLIGILEISIVSEINIDEIRGMYISILLWDMMVKNLDKPLDAMKVSLLLGYCLYLFLEIEEGYTS